MELSTTIYYLDISYELSNAKRQTKNNDKMAKVNS